MNRATRRAHELMIAATLMILAAAAMATILRPDVRAVAPLPFYLDAELTPTFLAEGDAESVHAIAPWGFVDQSGRSITQDDLDGKLYVASFIFTSCRGICPRMVGNLLRIQAAFEANEDVRLVSFSVTPDIDTTPVLRQYAEQKGIDGARWHLMTGDADTIHELARTSYFADGDDPTPSPSNFVHTENVMLIDGKRRIRGVYNGTLAIDMERLNEDIVTLLERQRTAS